MLRKRIHLQSKQLQRSRSALAISRQETSSCKERIKEYEARFGVLSGSTGPPNSNVWKLSESQERFLLTQSRAASTSKHGMRWTGAELRDSMALYLAGSAAYKEHAKVWRTPHPRTLQRTIDCLFEEVRKV